MTDATFERLSRSDKRIYGPRKLLLCGFNADTQARFNTLLEMLGLSVLPRVWATEAQGEVELGQLMSLEDGSGKGQSSHLPRAVVMAGISEQELHLLMSGARKAGMRNALWATMTPVSESWKLKDLLAALAKERDAMRQKRSRKK